MASIAHRRSSTIEIVVARSCCQRRAADCEKRRRLRAFKRRFRPVVTPRE